MEYVPVKLTSLYKLCKRYNEGAITPQLTWTEISKHSRKPYLSTKGLHDLINVIKDKTDGGQALSSSEIKKMILDKIKQEWKDKRRFHLLPEIPIVKSQSIFNIHSI